MKCVINVTSVVLVWRNTRVGIKESMGTRRDGREESLKVKVEGIFFSTLQRCEKAPTDNGATPGRYNSTARRTFQSNKTRREKEKITGASFPFKPRIPSSKSPFG